MPKMKTKSGAKKRFKLTATGRSRPASPASATASSTTTPTTSARNRGTKMLPKGDEKSGQVVHAVQPLSAGALRCHALKEALPTTPVTRRFSRPAEGYYGRRKSTIRIAKQAVDKAGQYAYRDRRVKKRNFRALWIQRINAAVRDHGLTYGRFIDGLSKAEVAVDRKVLSDLAITEPAAFGVLVAKAKAALGVSREVETTTHARVTAA